MCYGLLCAQNLFVKREINMFKIILITPFYDTTEVYPYLPTYWEFIYTHLFLFVITCESLFFLWEYFWIFSDLWSSVRIDFLSLYENKQTYESHHLKQIFYHQNAIMIFCWFRMFLFYIFCLEFFSFCLSIFLLTLKRLGVWSRWDSIWPALWFFKKCIF